MEMPSVTIATDATGEDVVVCVGEFDVDGLAALSRACAEQARPGRGLTLDVVGLGFADSSFLNELVKWRRRGPVVLVGPLPGQLRRLLELTDTLALFDVRTPA
ncbi:STAS domain-containing protein [Streptomyces sp. NPDC097619]|uniref:STAS domain-containing protein n=1 Tax=Streptomyces sp. NPDC097619 TaxID=3157228 RepID=UPI00332B882F